MCIRDRQYILTQTIETETRYRTETRTDSEGNTYTVEVPYTYYICNVKLENFDLSHLPIYILTEEQMGFYAAYMQTLGNRPDLFPNGFHFPFFAFSYSSCVIDFPHSHPESHHESIVLALKF